MIKRFFLTLAVLAGLLSPAIGAGTITISLTQRLDNSTHLPLSGGKIYFIQAGTTSTPQNAYQDSALTIPYANPLTLDSGGNIPQLFFADGVIKVRITNSLGVSQLVQDNIQVTGASSGGGGGGGTVDATTIMQTAFIAPYYGTGVRSGFVRLNGRTIGSSTSGATERANSDCQALFEYLWGADASLAVSAGRGASANADWVANKTIVLPDWRGRALAGLDDMGNTAAGRLTAGYFGTTATVLGAAGGGESLTLSIAQIPAHSHGGVTAGMNSNQTHSHNANDGVAKNGTSGGGGAFLNMWHGGNTTTATSSVDINHTHNIASEGGGAAHRTVQPTMLTTFYIKL